jgi:uncharacterized membrane protein
VKKRSNQSVNKSEQYASASDFCELFRSDAESLFQLAFVLTGNRTRAEESLLAALEDCFKAKVFKPWARSWSRLALIERALKSTAHDPDDQSEAGNGSSELQAILQLKAFDRFVYVLNVLEKYSVKDCAILLKASKREVVESKLRALESVTAFIGVPFADMESSVQLTA